MTQYQFNLSTTEPNNQIGLIRVRQNDDETQVFRVTVYENDVPKNLNNLTAEFNMVDVKKHIIVDKAHIIDAKNGVIEYRLRKEALQSVGRCNAYFSFKNNNEVIFSTKDFNYNVIWSALSSPMHHGCDYVWTAGDLIESLKDWIEHAMGDFDDWFESIKAILASIDPGGVILKELMDMKDRVEELEQQENTLYLKNKEVSFYSDVAVFSNTIPACFAVDEQRDYIYVYQGNTDIPTITRTTNTGAYLDKMDIPKGKDMKSLGLDYLNGNPNLWVETETELVRFPYVPNSDLSTSKDKKVIDLSKIPNRRQYGICVDNYADTFSCIVNDSLVIFSLSDIERGTLTKVKTINIDSDVVSSLCGFHYYDNSAYILSSEDSTRNPTYVTTYNETGRLLNYKVDIYGDIPEENVSVVRYPTGLQIIKNRTTHKLSVVFLMTRGRIGFRQSKLYAIHQKGNDIKRVNELMTIIKSPSSRVELVPEGTTRLSDISSAGEYYMTSAIAANIEDIPMPTGKHGYFLDNGATNSWGIFNQILKRNSQSTSQMKFERVINTLNGIVGEWNLIQGDMIGKVSYWDEGYNLSSVRYPVKYYSTSTEFEKFTDIPKEFKGSGYWIEISTLGSNEAVIQTVTRNTLDGFFQAKRIVAASGVGTFKVIS
ncbi:Phage upper baseplate protein (TP901-1-like ORF48) [Brachybacterium faecium]|nr:Phage upper baseplate protein (TP901-1-like ORF48) [Brachybacterium faecium]